MVSREHMQQSKEFITGRVCARIFLDIAKVGSQCVKHRVEKRKFMEQSFKPGVQPMEFISMDLVGEFHPPSSKGNRYALTAVCMLTNFVFLYSFEEQVS